MKYLAALCVLLFNVACSNGSNLDIWTDTWDVPKPKPPAADEEHLARPQPAFIPVTQAPVCQDEHSLLVGDGVRYILTQPLHQGEFSTFHYAVDANNVLWGVKKVPLDNHAHTAKPGVSGEDLVDALALWNLTQPDLRVCHVLQHDNDAYAVMPLMEDNIAALGALPQRALLAREMVLQVARDAAQLHQAGVVHHDVRPQNMLWNRQGRIALGDYQLARPLDLDGSLQRTHWYVVAQGQAQRGVAVRELIAAPEMRSGRHNTKADSWSLGLAALEVLVGKTDLFDALQSELAHHPEAYERWHAAVFAACGEVHLERIKDPSKVTVPPQNYLYDKAFTLAAEHDGGLTQAILAGLLNPDPARRWSMAQVRQKISSRDGPGALASMLQTAATANHGLRQARQAALHACQAEVPPPPPEPSGPAQDPRTTRGPESEPRQAFAPDPGWEASGASIRY